MRRIHLEFNNFQPTKEAIRFIRHEMEKIREISPSDAILSLSLTKENRKWNGKLSVLGVVARFNSHSSEDAELDASLRLFLDMREQLVRWAHVKILSLNPAG
jgi:hypothetical protein